MNLELKNLNKAISYKVDSRKGGFSKREKAEISNMVIGFNTDLCKLNIITNDKINKQYLLFTFEIDFKDIEDYYVYLGCLESFLRTNFYTHVRLDKET